jgi:asparagine synthetase B (glutamine-hydrolysing)
MKLQFNLNSTAQTEAQKIGNHSFLVTNTESSLVFEVGSTTVVIEGEFYYYLNNGKSVAIQKDNAKGIISEILNSQPIDKLSKVLEGMYCGIVIDKNNKLSVFSDAFNRKNFFYTQIDNQIVVSTLLEDIIDARPTIHYDQNGLYSYLLLGYSPIKHTFYKDIFRLGSDEIMIFNSNGMSSISSNEIINISEFDRSKIDLYDEYITNSVVSRASNTPGGNIVMNSGGWDSTSIVYLLTRHYDKTNVKSVVFEVLLSDKQSFNVYEVDKVKRISKHFGIDTETCVIDYSSKESIDIWERNLEKLRDNHVYFWIHHIKLAEQVGQHVATGSSIFSGEASDSIHNFGYSQFVSVNYNNMNLREYSDKMKSYLYGPTFLKSILDNTINEDKVYEFYKYYYGTEKFDMPKSVERSDLLNKYLQSFILSYQRVPFAKWKNISIANEAMNNSFENYVNDNYFEKLAKQIAPNNIYYNLLQIYRDFHFQSAQIQIANVAFDKFNLSCKMPFLDLNMVNYMYQMPEDWGRGLEIKTTKYPLRYLANERWKEMPLHILEESGPHSYIAENDKKWTYAGGNWDIYCEILYSSVFKDYFKDMFSKVDVEKYFDSNFFDVVKLKKIISDYLNNVEDIPNHGLLFKLAVLFSIGLKEKK